MSTIVTRPVAGARRSSSRQGAVSVVGVSKAFRLPHEQYHTLKQRALHPLRSSTYDVLQAVDDVSVDIGRGEFFGIIGRNGSGKSTLLKCIAGIYRIDRGAIQVHGRLSPFIELGVGFNMELTARDNVMINAVMLGLSRRQARERFDAIIDFAELHDFLDLRLRNYSSGMLVRLAFAVAIQVDPEILLIDEVLAVGDANFQQKCFDKFEEFKRQDRTILFVTHDMGAIERFCDRALLLDHGRMTELGDPSRVARGYNKLNFQLRAGSGAAPDAGPSPDGARTAATILDAWFEDQAGNRVAEMAYGERCTVAVEARINQPLENPILGVMVRTEPGVAVLVTSTDQLHGDTGRFEAGAMLVYRLRFDNWLTPGRYFLTPSIARHGLGSDMLDVRDDIASLVVHSGPWSGGVVQLPHEFEIEQR